MKQVLLILILVTILVLLIKQNDKSKVKITFNNSEYMVHRYDDHSIMEKIAKTIHYLHRDIDKLLLHLKVNEFPHKIFEIKRLFKRYKRHITDLPPNETKHVAYNVHKGRVIGLCIYKDYKFQDYNTIMFVLLHELAHVMTKEYKHNKQFWDNFKFLIKQAIKLNIYTYQDFNKNPKKYCKMNIKYTPLEFEK